MIVADRELVESGSDDILAGADKTDVAFLVVGDPFGYVPTLRSLSALSRPDMSLTDD